MTLPTRFASYAESIGVLLTRDDVKYLEKQLRGLPSWRHRSILSDYLQQYELGMREEQKAPLKQNKGRFRANTWIREVGVKIG